MDPYHLMAAWTHRRLRIEHAVAAACLDKDGAARIRAAGVSPKIIDDEACRLIVSASFVAWASGGCTAEHLAGLALREGGFTVDISGVEWLPYRGAEYIADLARWLLDADAKERRAKEYMAIVEKLMTPEIKTRAVQSAESIVAGVTDEQTREGLLFAFRERCAIAEVDGNLDREAAERIALIDLKIELRRLATPK